MFGYLWAGKTADIENDWISWISSSSGKGFLFRPLEILGLVATIDVSIRSSFDSCCGRGTKTEVRMVKAFQNR